MSTFFNLLIKELKSIIRDPKMLIAMFVVPLIMIGIMYGVMAAAMQEQAKQVEKESKIVAIIDLDHGPWSQRFIDYLESIGISVKLVKSISETNIADLMERLGVKILYVIPSNFSDALTANKTAIIEYYVLLKSLTLGEFGLGASAEGLIDSFAENIARSIITREGIPKEFIEHPVNGSIRAIVGNKVFTRPEQVFMGVFMISFIIPLVAFLMLIFIIQFAVTSMAVEKEEKMFETLLTLPVNRLTIIGVKLLVSVIIGIAYVAIYGFILVWFFTGSITVTSGTTTSVNVLDILPPATTYYLGLGLIGAVIFGLLLAMVLSLFAEDVRTAQLISNYALMPLIFMFFIPMFIDISGLPYTVKTILSMIPLANIGFIPKLSMLGHNELAMLAGISNIVYAAIALTLAYKIVNTEKIFTAKFFKRIKKKK